MDFFDYTNAWGGETMDGTTLPPAEKPEIKKHKLSISVNKKTQEVFLMFGEECILCLENKAALLNFMESFKKVLLLLEGQEKNGKK